MRLFVVVFLGVFLLLTGSIVPALAAPYATMMDEYGPGSYKDLAIPNDTWHTWNGTLRPDPTWAGHTSLIYIGGTRGPFQGLFDLAVHEPSGAISDVLRFYNPPAGGNTWIIFYSADTNGGAPADTGFPRLAVYYNVNEDAN